MPLTRGGSREILRLALPAFGSLIAEPVFLLTDSIIVGHLPDPALGALGVASTALSALVGICIFLAYGTTATVARQIGAGAGPSSPASGPIARSRSTRPRFSRPR